MAEENIKCPKCGNEISSNQKFCSECGAKLDEEKEKMSDVDSFKKVYYKNKSNKNKKDLAAFLITCILFFSIAGLIYYEYNEDQTRKQEAQRVAREKQAVEVEKLYKAALNDYSNNNIGYAWDKAQRLPNTKQEYIILRKKINLEVDIKSGDEFMQKGDYKNAIKEYQKAEKLKKGSAIAKLNNAKALQTQLINSMESRITTRYDKVENITWYYDKVIEPYLSYTNVCYLCLGITSDNKIKIRFIISYDGQFRDLKNTVTFNIDGKKYEYEMDESKALWKPHDGIFDINVWINYDLDYDKYKAVVHSIINSNTAYIRLYNISNEMYDREITNTEKESMRFMLNYFDMIKK